MAVANAEPSIKEIAGLVTQGEAGTGIGELVDELVQNDLSRTYDLPYRPRLTLGTRTDGTSVTVPSYGLNLLVAGPSGSGKSTATTGIVEQLLAREYQLCMVDPEGDYGVMDALITLGNERHVVFASEVIAPLEDPQINVNVNLLGLPPADRPAFFSQLFPSVQAMRTRTGRPHWMILDEAPHTDQTARIERRRHLAPGETGASIRNAIRGRYTLPA